MAWRITVSAAVNWGISAVGWRFSTVSQYRYVSPGYFIIDEDEIPDNVSVYLTVQLESGYNKGRWSISRDGGAQTEQEAVTIQISKNNSSVVNVLVVGVEAPTPPPTPTYSVRARKSTNSGEGIASVSVSQAEAERGESVRFTATLTQGYVFLAWATVDGFPTASTIVSTDADFWYTVYEDTTLYAYAGRPQSGVNILAVRDGAWHPASLVVVATKNGAKRWRNTALACVDGNEWKH